MYHLILQGRMEVDIFVENKVKGKVHPRTGQEGPEGE
jgi:hypothetical protein